MCFCFLIYLLLEIKKIAVTHLLQWTRLVTLQFLWIFSPALLLSQLLVHSPLLHYFITTLGKVVTSSELVWHLYLVRLCYNPLYSQRNSNPCLHRERVMSQASRRQEHLQKTVKGIEPSIKTHQFLTLNQTKTAVSLLLLRVSSRVRSDNHWNHNPVLCQLSYRHHVRRLQAGLILTYGYYAHPVSSFVLSYF